MNTGIQEVAKSQGQIIGQLASCEIAIGKLYGRYGEKFPNMREFWLSLADQEKAHASLLLGLQAALPQTQLLFNLDRFTTFRIAATLRYIEGRMSCAESRNVPLPEALSVAVNLENTLIEAHFYDIVKCDAPEFKYVASRLAADTQRHAAELSRMILSHGKTDMRLSA